MDYPIDTQAVQSLIDAAQQPSPETRRRINAELARAMGYSIAAGNGGFWICKPSGESLGGGGWADEESAWEDAPDFFTDHAANAELVAWVLAPLFLPTGKAKGITQSASIAFMEYLRATRTKCPSFLSMTLLEIASLLTSPLQVRTLAACAALGIVIEGD